MAQAAGGFDLQRSLNYLKVKITGGNPTNAGPVVPLWGEGGKQV
jgi:hypothetical protein